MTLYGHSIKNPHIKHWTFKREDDGEIRYICIQPCGITPSKIADTIDKVTCKNCLRKIRNMGLKILKDGITL